MEHKKNMEVFQLFIYDELKEFLRLAKNAQVVSPEVRILETIVKKKVGKYNCFLIST